MSRVLSLKMLRHYVSNFLALKIRAHQSLKPLFFTHYLNLKCNFKCSYCNFHKKQALQDIKTYKELNTADTIKLMQIIYEECPYIYFTGGEPLLRSDLLDIVKACNKMGFKSISINTNMSLIHKKMDILDHITNLVASFDVFDDTKNSKVLGVSESIVRQTKSNIIECSKLQKKKNFVMTVNCVIIPETISDVRDVMDFCFQHNIRLAIVPAELDNGGIDVRLINNEEYRRLIKDIIAAKKSGRPIFGSLKYLDTIYNFKRFDCYPTLTPHTYPDGSLFYPCQPMMKVAANLLETGSYEIALAQGINKYGTLPNCRDKCYKACYIEPSNIIKNPLLLIKENI